VLSTSKLPLQNYANSKEAKIQYHLSQNTYRLRINGQDYFFGQGNYLEFIYPNGQSDFFMIITTSSMLFAVLKAFRIKNRSYVTYDDHSDVGPEDGPMPATLTDPFQKAQYYHIANFQRGVAAEVMPKRDGWQWTWISHQWSEPQEEEKQFFDHIVDLQEFSPSSPGGMAGVDLDISSRGAGDFLTYDDTVSLYQRDREIFVRQFPSYEVLAFFISGEHFIKPAAALWIFW